MTPQEQAMSTLQTMSSKDIFAWLETFRAMRRDAMVTLLEDEIARRQQSAA